MSQFRGALTLNFSYVDNSGTAKSGTFAIPYAGTTNNSVVATATPSGEVVALAASGTQPVTVSFTTSDGNPATGFAVTAASLSPLPVVISRGYAYLPQGNTHFPAIVTVCAVGSGSVSNCADSIINSSTSTAATFVAVAGSLAYVTVQTNFGNWDIYVCDVSSSDGSLSNRQISDGGQAGGFPNVWYIAAH